MSIFQNSVVKKQLQSQDKSKLAQQWVIFKNHFFNATIQNNIRHSKEEQYQGEFLIDLFVTVLGYTKSPTPNFNLTTEYKNVKDSKKADGAILINAKVKAVIELKGTNTIDLGKIEVQAFGYKNNQPDCVYVITSNFEKLRFYIDNATEFLEFNLFQLSEKEFELLYLCLAYDNISNDIPKKLKDQSASEEKNITKQLYTDYSLFKRELHQNLVALNPNFNALELFKKSQKLLDRFLFIFFAEDRNLLPTNLIFRINKEWRQLQEMRMNISLYDRYKTYFNDLNKGAKVILPAFSQTANASLSKEEHQIFAYNGGLFQPDAVLDGIIIDDELLFTHTQKMSKYDFLSEVDVNILGHIFENSLNELDEIKAQLQSSTPNSLPTEMGISKRKKDGVFYTPKYITKYIVDNTVGKLCADKKVELQLNEEDYYTDKKRSKTTKQPLLEKLNQYRTWLLQITICDPACGSGAFLNQALDFLIAEHQYIDELQAKLFGDGLILSDVEKTILENNLFGVDLNEESVEIAKLSLWLRTAQPNRKLNDLNNNIQCGNSLIDDVAVAGDKAFNWHTAFPKIFKEKNKKAWHITTAIHDSRTSQRMIDYKVREKRAMGTMPEPQINYLTDADEMVIAKTVALLSKELQINIMEFNVCRDHMHLVVVCDETELNEIVRKIKGRTAREVNINKGLQPLVKEKNEKSIPLWTQKFGCKEIVDENQLSNTLTYVKNNRIKHNLPAHSNKGFKPLVESIACDYNFAFRDEYTGGFDVVIGNPPYVNLYNMNSLERDYFNSSTEFPSTYLKYDLYVLFFDKGFKILKHNGKLAFIIPSVILSIPYGKFIRKQILESYTINKIVDFTGFRVFEDAMVESCILIISKIKSVDSILASYKPKDVIADFAANCIQINQNDFLTTDSFQFRLNLNGNSITIIDKIKSGSVTLESIYYISKGIVAFSKIDNRKKDDFLFSSKINAKCKPYLEGKDSNRYYINFDEKYLEYDLEIMSRPTFPELHEKSKIIIRAISDGLKATFDNNGYYIDQKLIICSKRYEIEKYIVTSKRPKTKHLNNNNLIDDVATLALLNSKLYSYYYNVMLKGGVSILPEDIRNFPVFLFNVESQQPFIEKANQMLSFNKELQLLAQKFQRTLQRKFELGALPKKLQDWYVLSYADFIKELSKQKVKLSLSQEAQWEDYFSAEAKKALAIKNEIDATDKAIDGMVYELYGLTDEEIKIVERG